MLYCSSVVESLKPAASSSSFSSLLLLLRFGAVSGGGGLLLAFRLLMLVSPFLRVACVRGILCIFGTNKGRFLLKKKASERPLFKSMNGWRKCLRDDNGGIRESEWQSAGIMRRKLRPCRSGRSKTRFEPSEIASDLADLAPHATPCHSWLPRSSYN